MTRTDQAKALREYVDGLTIAKLREYANTTDRLLWIDYNVLDHVADGLAFDEWAEVAEERIDAALSEICSKL